MAWSPRSRAATLLWMNMWPCCMSHVLAGRAARITNWQPLQNGDATWKYTCSLLMRYIFVAHLHLPTELYTQVCKASCACPWMCCCFLLLLFVWGNICCFCCSEFQESLATVIYCTIPPKTSQDLLLPLIPIGKLVYLVPEVMWLARKG